MKARRVKELTSISYVRIILSKKKPTSKDKEKRNGRFDVNLMSFSHRGVIGKKKRRRGKAPVISLCGRRCEGRRELRLKIKNDDIAWQHMSKYDEVSPEERSQPAPRAMWPRLVPGQGQGRARSRYRSRSKSRARASSAKAKAGVPALDHI